MLTLLWRKWLSLSERVGDLVARTAITLLYFIIFSIPGIWFTRVVDRVGRRFSEGTYFTKSEDLVVGNTLDEARQM